MDTFIITLIILAKGMLGIFVSIFIIMFFVWFINKLASKK